ncbi:ABC transporter permease [Microbacterium sp. NPDC096154]|uniref:ABC transporter permease n=1 Tax=Microbacterium sp. NPDC096154 TaxID=3155549 RepID=UPI003327ED15
MTQVMPRRSTHGRDVFIRQLVWLVPVIVLAVIIGLSYVSGSFYFPPAGRVWEAFREEWLFARVPTDLLPSLYRMFTGYLVGCVLAILVGLVLGLVPWLAHATRPIVEFFRAIPPAILIPIAMIVFGLGDEMKISVIAFAAFFPVLLNTVDGVLGVDKTTAEMSRSYGVPAFGRLLHVILPATLPRILAGMRISLALAIVVMVVTEMFGGGNGIGYFILEQEKAFKIPGMWGGVILIGLIGFLANVLFVVVEKRILFWYDLNSQGSGK